MWGDTVHEWICRGGERHMLRRMNGRDYELEWGERANVCVWGVYRELCAIRGWVRRKRKTLKARKTREKILHEPARGGHNG